MDRWKCLCCLRDKFDRPYQPHRCCCGTSTKNWKKIAKARGIIGPSFVKVEETNVHT